MERFRTLIGVVCDGEDCAVMGNGDAHQKVILRRQRLRATATRGMENSLDKLISEERAARFRSVRTNCLGTRALAGQFAVGEIVETNDGDAVVVDIDLISGNLRLRFGKGKLRRGQTICAYSPRVVRKKKK